MTVLYGIKNCTTVKKARAWLEQHGIAYQFHDYKTAGISEPLLDEFINTFGWEALINKRGTTWRQLNDDQKHRLSPDTVKALLLAHPTLIKRPILRSPSRWLIGFTEAEYQQL